MWNSTTKWISHAMYLSSEMSKTISGAENIWGGSDPNAPVTTGLLGNFEIYRLEVEYVNNSNGKYFRYLAWRSASLQCFPSADCASIEVNLILSLRYFFLQVIRRKVIFLWLLFKKCWSCLPTRLRPLHPVDNASVHFLVLGLFWVSCSLQL